MTVSFDVLVVGGGLAGMVTANRCAQQGLRTLVVEKGTSPGGQCNARISSGLFHLAWQPLDAPVGILERAIAATTDGEADISLARALARASGRVGAWLIEEGIEFRPSKEDPAYKWHVAPHGTNVRTRIQHDRGTDQMMRRLYSNFIGRGGEIRYACRAIELRNDRDKWWLRVRHSEGDEWLGAPRVCLCDGGFQANPEMLSRYIGPQAPQMVLRAMPSSTGDALKMALAVGARAVGLGRFYGHIQSADAEDKDLWPYPSLDDLCVNGIILNRDGTSIRHAIDNGIQLANILARTEDPRGWFTVITEEQWRTLGVAAVPHGACAFHDLERLGGTVHFDSHLERLASKLGVPAESLTEEAELRYGSHAFASSWVGFPIVPGITFTAGGIAVNENAEVVDDDARPLPGLFAAGSTCGGLHGGPRGGYLGGLSVAAITGWLAATSIT